MSPTGGSMANEIVLVLTRAVKRALDPAEADRTAPMARDVAQVLGLDGLDRALRVYTLAGGQREPLAEQIRRLCERAAVEGSLAPFIEADAELGRLAASCGVHLEVEGELAAPGGTLRARDALDDLPLADDASREAADRVPLTAQVTAALRAALDWLHEGEGRRPLRLLADDSALIVRCPHIQPLGLHAATAVIAAVGGNLGPELAGAGRLSAGGWILRVPIATMRETYLMLSQGDLDLAIPWHAVLRLAMTPRVQLDTSLRALGLPLLEPFVPLSTRAPEYPVVMVAHGLARAYLVADRLVWRLPAAPCEAPPDPRVPDLDRCVAADDGTVYRVVDPMRLLAGVEPVVTPEFGARRAGAAPPAESPADPGAAGAAPAAAPDGDSVAGSDEPALEMLDAERVTPLPLRTLVAEDSIAHRLLLEQQLGRMGLEVHAVGTAAELFAALESETWALVCVDVDLPDARGLDLLRGLSHRAHQLPTPPPLVALVRDEADAETAARAGFVRTLRKPCEAAALTRLFASLGLDTSAST